jgi:hypothetical protein
MLGCSIDKVRECGESEMSAYGVSLKTDMFQSYPGLAFAS